MPYKDKAKKAAWEKENRGRGARHRTWMLVFYEDSSDPLWIEICEELGIPICVSPKHDMDVWTALDERKNAKHKAGTAKKTHRHAIVEYPQPVDYAQVKEDFSFLHSGNIKYVKSKASMALYLCHIGTPEKAQYNPAEVLEFGGANWHDWCSELQDIHATMVQMRTWLRENVALHHWEFSDFVDWCDENSDEWSRALDLQCSWAIGNYMDKQRAKVIYLGKVEREMVREQKDAKVAEEVEDE